MHYNSKRSIIKFNNLINKNLKDNLFNTKTFLKSLLKIKYDKVY